jgi:hypothetical protein
LAGLAVALCIAIGSVMVTSPTALEKWTKPEEPALVPSMPDDGAWIAESEDDLVARLVDDPVKLRGLRAFSRENQVALKQIMQHTEEVVRHAARDVRASGRLGREEREAVDRTLTEYAAELERLSAVR